MEVTASFKSDVGTFRKQNEDAHIFIQNKTGQSLAVVCDGLGGHSCGEVASNMAVKMFKEFFQHANWKKLTTDNEVYQWLKNCVAKIQNEMNEYIINHEEASDMGTTMVVTLIANNKAYLVNIGDSRIYLFNNQGLKQLTRDHNVLNLYLKEHPNKIEEMDVNKTYWKALTSALGPIKNLKVDIFDLHIVPPSYFLLTSDGVHDFLEEWEISDILEKHTSLKHKVKMLIQQAVTNVSTDNLTALLLHIND